MLSYYTHNNHLKDWDKPTKVEIIESASFDESLTQIDNNGDQENTIWRIKFKANLSSFNGNAPEGKPHKLEAGNLLEPWPRRHRRAGKTIGHAHGQFCWADSLSIQIITLRMLYAAPQSTALTESPDPSADTGQDAPTASCSRCFPRFSAASSDPRCPPPRGPCAFQRCRPSRSWHCDRDTHLSTKAVSGITQPVVCKSTYYGSKYESLRQEASFHFQHRRRDSHAFRAHPSIDEGVEGSQRQPYPILNDG